MMYPMDLEEKIKAMAQPIRENLKTVWNMDTEYHLESMAKSHIEGNWIEGKPVLTRKKIKRDQSNF